MTPRTLELIREEIRDLTEYLSNLPPELRDGPYGDVYVQRLTGLQDEVAQVELS